MRSDGSEGELNGNQSLAVNLDLASNPFYREYTDTIALSGEVAALPDMQGSGAVRDFREAAMLNAGLRDQLAVYAQASTREQQLALLDNLLHEWAESSSYRNFMEVWLNLLGGSSCNLWPVSLAGRLSRTKSVRALWKERMSVIFCWGKAVVTGSQLAQEMIS